MDEKCKERTDANKHPLIISKPFAFSEEILQQYDWSPTARMYLRAYKLVKEGLDVLCTSKFIDERGITLIAHGYLTENSILQAFPQMQNLLLPYILQLCEKVLFQNPCFFEGLLLSFALRGYKSERVSKESCKDDSKAVMCIMNLIHLIQKAEPNSPPSKDPFEFDKNYTSWLHVLYYHAGTIYTILAATEQAAEAFESSLKCCPCYFESKRGRGYSLLGLYASKQASPNLPLLLRAKIQTVHNREISKYESWTAENLRDTTVKVLKEYLEEAPHCYKTYPNVCYYLADIAFSEREMNEFRKYFELGQDAEEKRLPFFDPVNLPLKDRLVPFYQLFVNVKERERCGNKTCMNKVKEIDLKFCGGCGIVKYCNK